jgi:hypothetical protein
MTETVSSPALQVIILVCSFSYGVQFSFLSSLSPALFFSLSRALSVCRTNPPWLLVGFHFPPPPQRGDAPLDSKLRASDRVIWPWQFRSGCVCRQGGPTTPGPGTNTPPKTPLSSLPSWLCMKRLAALCYEFHWHSLSWGSLAPLTAQLTYTCHGLALSASRS